MNSMMIGKHLIAFVRLLRSGDKRRKEVIREAIIIEATRSGYKRREAVTREEAIREVKRSGYQRREAVTIEAMRNGYNGSEGKRL